MVKRNILLLLTSIVLSSISVSAQSNPTASGGEGSGLGGTISYSIGQTVYSYQEGSNGDINQGVQQPYEIYYVGVDENDFDISLLAFPNPVKNYLTLQIETVNERMDLEIVDVTGKIIHSQKGLKTTTKFDFTAYIRGVYFLKVISENNEVKTFKIIKN